MFTLNKWKNQIAFKRDRQERGIRFASGGDQEFRFEQTCGAVKWMTGNRSMQFGGTVLGQS